MTYDPHEGMVLAAIIVMAGIAAVLAAALLLARGNGYL